jgi:hypothetical protein
MLNKKLQAMHGCEFDTLNELSGEAWLKMFDATCTLIAPEARTLIVPEVRTVCHQQK